MSGPEQYKIESTVLERDCYRLLTIVHSSKSLHERMISLKREQDEGKHSVNPETLAYHVGMEEWEANRILINLAIVVRNRLESSPMLEAEDGLCGLVMTAKQHFEETKPEPFPETPEQIWYEFQRQGVDKEPLLIRDTCNKIIHAKGVYWGREPLDEARPLISPTDGNYLCGFLFLYGDRQVQRERIHNWVAMINVEAFALNASRHI